MWERKPFVTEQISGFQMSNGDPVDRIVIALHGFGDSAKNFSELASEIPLENTQWICLQGPKEVPVSMGGAQWYELFKEPFVDMEAALHKVTSVIEWTQKNTTVPLSKVVLLGFSQGANMALYTALRYSQSLGAIVALSGYLGQCHRLVLPLSEEIKKVPVFIAHGLQDQVVFPYSFFEAVDQLKWLGMKSVTHRTYGMPHSLCAEEVKDLATFLKEKV